MVVTGCMSHGTVKSDWWLTRPCIWCKKAVIRNTSYIQEGITHFPSHVLTEGKHIFFFLFSNLHNEAISLQGTSKANDFLNHLRASYVLNLKWSVSTSYSSFNLINFISPEDKLSKSQIPLPPNETIVPRSFSKTIFTWTDLRWG